MDQNLQDAITQLVKGQLASGLAQMQAKLSAAVSQQQQLTAAAIAASQTQSAPQAPSGPAEEEEAWTSETAWEDVLSVLKRPANAGAGEALVARLAHPPPLEKLKGLQRDITGRLRTVRRSAKALCQYAGISRALVAVFREIRGTNSIQQALY